MESNNPSKNGFKLARLSQLVISGNWGDRRQAVKDITDLISAQGQMTASKDKIESYLDKLSKDAKWEVRNDVALAMLRLKGWHCFDGILARLSKDDHYDVRRSAEQILKRSRQKVDAGLWDEDLTLAHEEYEQSLRKILPAKVVNAALKLSQKRFELFIKTSNHELKGVLTTLHSRILKAKALVLGRQSKKLKEHLCKAEERSDFLTRLLDNMESWIVDSPPNFTRENLNDVVAEALSLAQDYFEERRPSMKIETTIKIPSEIYVDIPRVRILQAFRNIILNAYEALDKSGAIGICGEIRGGDAFLTFEDNGCGISEETRKVAFLPFTSTKNSTGFGLPISRKIIHEDCGGDISFSDEPRKGTIVLVSLPLERETSVSKS